MHTPTHTQFVDAYLAHLRQRRCSPRTLDTYRSILRRADHELDGLITAGSADIDAWLGYDRWSPKTHALYLAAVRGLFGWAYQQGLITHNTGADLARPKLPRRVPTPATGEQVDTILATCPQPVWLWSLIAARAGARGIEISRLDRRDITEQATRLHGKGDHERLVPTDPDIWRAVRDLPAGPIAGGITERQLTNHAWKTYRRIGVPIGIHRLRGWFATTLVAAGVPLPTVQQLLGHVSLATTQVYLGVDQAAMRAAVAALPSVAYPQCEPHVGQGLP